jgi:glutamate-5-semialdehyde dehydrogenase
MTNLQTISIEKTIPDELEKVKKASRQLAMLDNLTIDHILYQLADLAISRTPYLLEENKKDLERMSTSNPKYDRLMLTPQRLKDIASDLRKVAALPSPLHIQLEHRTLPNGLILEKVSVPMGTIGIIFESRPNVTFDVFALCLKSGNASVLKGSRDAHHSNLAIKALIDEVLKKYNIEHACYLAPSEREALPPILNAVGYIDVAIPRGSQALIDFVREHAKIPVIETGAGIVHTYYDKSASFEKGKAIIENAKARRVSVCNALDCLIIHKDRLGDLPQLLSNLGEVHQCHVFADEQAHSILEHQYPSDLLFAADETSFGTEFLSMKMAVKTVSNAQEALDHIATYSSKHSESIIAEEESIIRQFLLQVDAAVVYANTSTAFTDGAQFGMGAEIGISTQKLHARGPMALSELTSYKWIVQGDGQIRQ